MHRRTFRVLAEVLEGCNQCSRRQPSIHMHDFGVKILHLVAVVVVVVVVVVAMMMIMMEELAAMITMRK